MTATLADKLFLFYKKLQPPADLPNGIEILFPHKDKQVLKVIEIFLRKFYSDNRSRHLIFGINPGRFGAGTTGINFTAPKQLKEFCSIDHPFKEQTELSAEFIYQMIAQYGGPEVFYHDYFISSVSPLGFIKHKKNINYYDDKKLQSQIIPLIFESIQKQISFGFKTDFCVCIGEGKNFQFLSSLNDKYNFFGKIIPLPHPRFILQYRRRQKVKYIEQYLLALK